MFNLTPLDIARFWMNVEIDKNSYPVWKGKHCMGQCWIWKGSLFTSGYGRFGINNKSFRAHRISYYLYNGTISKEKLICHRCDNPKCVNPKHLFEGTPKDNTHDMLKKGRKVNPGRHKISTSGFHGVFYLRSRKDRQWRAKIWHNYKCIHAGYHDTELEAAHAYDAKVKELDLDKPLNFP